MSVIVKKTISMGLKAALIVCSPTHTFIRLRKYIKKLPARHFKTSVLAAGVVSCVISVILFAWYYHLETSKHSYYMIQYTARPMSHMNLNELYEDRNTYSDEGIDYFLRNEVNNNVKFLDTPGCQIPLLVIDYAKNNTTRNLDAETCGKRAVFLSRTLNKTNRVSVIIEKQYLNVTKGGFFNCCYSFLSWSDTYGELRNSSCEPVHDGDTFILQSDFINIKCFSYDNHNNQSHEIYGDYYAFPKKKSVPKYNNTCDYRYNVLMIGMDTMSLPRFLLTMPRTFAYIKDNFWLNFRGYNKIADNTLPNIIAAMTGKEFDDFNKTCFSRMDYCNDLLIWSKFREAGYVTAYGEDHLRLPETFNGDFVYRKPPTDHYLKPFFHKREREVDKTLVCTGKVPSGKQLLDYAVDFANTYRDDHFFGMFWINSFSHNANSWPGDADTMFEDFFNRLTYTGVLKDTFVIFYSDHGVRFGKHRLDIASYYDERMPMLFMWTPTIYRMLYPLQIRHAFYNQYNLVTPYDLYNTLVDISASSCNKPVNKSEGCANCQSVYSNEISQNRTCKDVGISEKWCSCHDVHTLHAREGEGVKAVVYVIAQINDMIKKIKPKQCWVCLKMAIQKVIRIHFYYDSTKTKLFYIVAFSVTPGSIVYEAVVVKTKNGWNLVGPVSHISAYRGLGGCTVNRRDRLFCACQVSVFC